MRRSCQTVMYMMLDNMARLMAPVLSFTSEEIWVHMPGNKGPESSIHLEQFPAVNEEFKDSALAAKWERLLAVRGEITKALEEARVKKVIGHSLDAAVTISADSALYDELYPYAEEMKTISPEQALMRYSSRNYSNSNHY